MSGLFNKAQHTTGLGLNQNKLYNRAFEKGVFLRNFRVAADTFDKAARKFAETGDQMLAAQATANGLLYRYLANRDAGIIGPLLRVVSQLQQIEVIGSQTEMMPTGPLCAELDCRLVEAALVQAQDDVLRSRDLHKLARDKFQAIIRNPLITYGYVTAIDGHNDRPDMRHFYHSGMYSFYEAMTKKDTDPSLASDDLSLAVQAFRRCNDQTWVQKVSNLLEDWRFSRTCWMCHREMQGSDLHFTMCRAVVTPYTKRILETLKQDVSTMSMDGRIAVCTPCGSMVTFKAAEEANKVRQELDAKILTLKGVISNLEYRVSGLERRSHVHF